MQLRGGHRRNFRHDQRSIERDDAYTVSPINVSNYTYTLDNEVQGAGSTHVILRQNGVFVADLSVSGGFTVGGDLFANSSSSQESSGCVTIHCRHSVLAI